MTRALLVLALVSACTPAPAAPAPAPVPAPPALNPAPAPALGAAPEETRWPKVAEIIGVSEAALFECKTSSECVAEFHFAKCCTHIAYASKHEAAWKKSNKKLSALQTDAEKRWCAFADCSGAGVAAACVQGRCVVDSERELWTRVGDVVRASADDLRACSVASDCAVQPHFTRCCAWTAVARGYAPETEAKASEIRKLLQSAADIERCQKINCPAEPPAPACVRGWCATLAKPKVP